MRFQLDWQDGATNAAPEERATVADMSIFVAGENVCDHVLGDGRELEGPIAVSAYPAAEALALNWWQIFGRRGEEKFKLIEWRDGYLVPDIRLRFDGAVFELESVPCRYSDIPVRFPRQETEWLARNEAEGDLSDFVSRVVERLDNCKVRGTSLQLRWARVTASRHDADEASFCEAAGALELDPYDIAEADAALIEAAGALFHGETLTEFLSGLRTPSPMRVLDWIRNVEDRRPSQSRLRAAADIRDCHIIPEHTEIRPGERAWARGYRCARVARRALCIDETERLKSLKVLAGRLEAPSFRPVSDSTPGLRALVRSSDDDVRIHISTARRMAPGAQLFAFARALGDAVINSPTGLSAINDLRDAARQAASRAFAAEFLAPVSEVLAMREDNWDIEAIAREFGVSPQAIERQIENRDNIEQACAA